jgi:hypothetical protein
MSITTEHVPTLDVPEQLREPMAAWFESERGLWAAIDDVPEDGERYEDWAVEIVTQARAGRLDMTEDHLPSCEPHPTTSRSGFIGAELDEYAHRLLSAEDDDYPTPLGRLTSTERTRTAGALLTFIADIEEERERAEQA